jgi:dihydroorotate dehydrogenase electron transfer subunit
MTDFPLSLAGTHTRCHIAAIREENYRTRTLILDRPLAAQPGQFVMLWLPGVGEKPFSVAGDDPFTLTVVDVGAFSHAVTGLNTGDSIWVRGPLGQGYQILGKRLLLVGGGYGAAPLSFLAKRAIQAGLSVDVCLGARQAQDVILREPIAEMGAGVFVSTDDGSLGEKALVTQVAEQRIAANPPDGIYACGPVKMLEAVEALAGRHHIPCQLSWEAFMRCGMGLCGHCELELPPTGDGAKSHHRPGWLVCQDGPVSFSS